MPINLLFVSFIALSKSYGSHNETNPYPLDFPFNLFLTTYALIKELYLLYTLFKWLSVTSQPRFPIQSQQSFLSKETKFLSL